MDKNIMHEEIMADWDKAMLANQIPNLQKNIEQLIKLMTDGILNREYENLQFLFQAGAKRIEAWGNRLDLDIHEDYYKVFSYAVFWMSKKISDRLYNNQQKENQAQKKYEEIEPLKNAKNIVLLLELLETNGELPQGVIAKRLSLSTQALSNLLRRYEKYQLWEYKKQGRYNFYHLTNDGKNYLHMIQRKEYRENNDISHILTYVLECFVEEVCKPNPDIDHIIHRINKQFGGTQVIFGDETDKLAIRKSIRKIRNSNRRRERSYKFSFDSYLPDIYDLPEDCYRMEPQIYLGREERRYINDSIKEIWN